jgi:hypothetical protein
MASRVDGWKKKLLDLLISLYIVERDFTGRVTIAIHEGNVKGVEKSESLK